MEIKREDIVNFADNIMKHPKVRGITIVVDFIDASEISVKKMNYLKGEEEEFKRDRK